MASSTTGFAVVYRWRLHRGREAEFLQSWQTLTNSLRQERGALGSRLHQAEDGTWVAYAQWPSRECWDRSRALGSPDPAAAAAMNAAIEESFEPILLVPVSDLLAAHEPDGSGTTEA